MLAGSGTQLHNPKANVAPDPAYMGACYTLNPNGSRCLRRTLAAIDHARSAEGVRKPMILPRNFRSLSLAKQTFVITDLERVDRGLPPYVGLVRSMNNVAGVAARADTDPSPASNLLREFSVAIWGGNWAGDFGPLPADYDWMYNDGPNSGNLACTSAQSPGCWGHRDNILYRYPSSDRLLTGVGVQHQTAWISIAQIFVAAGRHRVHMTYTWREALAHGADGHR